MLVNLPSAAFRCSFAAESGARTRAQLFFLKCPPRRGDAAQDRSVPGIARLIHPHYFDEARAARDISLRARPTASAP